MTSLYCHPAVTQALQLAIGMPLSPHTVATSDLHSEGGAAPSTPVAPLHLPERALEVGSRGFVCALAMLALSTGTLRSMALSHKASIETGAAGPAPISRARACPPLAGPLPPPLADIPEEDDYFPSVSGLDFAWSTSSADALALLRRAEAAVIGAVPVGARQRLEALGVRAPPPPKASAAAKSAKKSGGAASGPSPAPAPLPTAALVLDSPDVDPAALPCTDPADDAEVAAWGALLARLRFRRAYLLACVLLSREFAAPAPAPLRWGFRYDLDRTYSALSAARALLDIVRRSSPFAPAYDIPGDACGAVPAFARSLVHGGLPRFVPLPPLAQAFVLWHRHLGDALAICDFPALASHNPRVPNLPQAAAAAPAPSTTVLGSGALPPGAATPAWLPSTPHAVPTPFAASLIAALLAAGKASVAAAPAASSAGGAPASLSVEPPPRVPSSGLVDQPMLWPDFTGPTAPIAMQNSEVLPMPAREVSVGGPRAHVSLMAIFDALESFSTQNANLVVRAWLERVVCGSPLRPAAGGKASQQPHASLAALPAAVSAPGDVVPASADAAPTGVPVPDSTEAEAGYSDFPLAPAKSMAILGSHTLFELVLAALVDAGLLPELVRTTELLRFAYITDKVRASMQICWMGIPLLLSLRLCRSSKRPFSSSAAPACACAAAWTFCCATSLLCVAR